MDDEKIEYPEQDFRERLSEEEIDNFPTELDEIEEGFEPEEDADEVEEDEFEETE